MGGVGFSREAIRRVIGAARRARSAGAGRWLYSSPARHRIPGGRWRRAAPILAAVLVSLAFAASIASLAGSSDTTGASRLAGAPTRSVSSASSARPRELVDLSALAQPTPSVVPLAPRLRSTASNGGFGQRG